MLRNLSLHPGMLTRSSREQLLGQRGSLLWFTGLSGAGKSTIARATVSRIAAAGKIAYVLDGDDIRHGLSSDLGFSDADRRENIRRVGEVAALFVDAGLITITALISPFRTDRERVRAIVGEERFLEIFVDAPLELCEQRDPKGLYRRARAGEIDDFTGINSPYEPPLAPALTLRTGELDPDACADVVTRELERRELLSAPPS